MLRLLVFIWLIFVSTTQEIHFPKLKKLGLERAGISKSSLHTLIAGCPALECLLLAHIDGFRCVRINSITLTSFGVKGYLGKIIIDNAPRLERLLQKVSDHSHISVISAPKLQTLGCLSSISPTRIVLHSIFIQVAVVFLLAFTGLHFYVLVNYIFSALIDDGLMLCLPCS